MQNPFSQSCAEETSWFYNREENQSIGTDGSVGQKPHSFFTFFKEEEGLRPS